MGIEITQYRFKCGTEICFLDKEDTYILIRGDVSFNVEIDRWDFEDRDETYEEWLEKR